MKGLRPEVFELEFAEDAGEKGRIQVDSVDGAFHRPGGLIVFE
jgi:hypothetical protein